MSACSNALDPTDLSVLGITIDFTQRQSPKWTSTPSDRVRLPSVLKEENEKHPRLIFDDEGLSQLCAYTQRRHSCDDLHLPHKNRRELEHFLNGYLNYFYRHLVIPNLPSLKGLESPSTLIYGMCAIGALYSSTEQGRETSSAAAAGFCRRGPQDNLHLWQLNQIVSN